MTLKKNDFQTIGQFFTEKNVFEHSAFLSWLDLIELKDKKFILEPFAGKNGIVDMLKEIPQIDIATQYISYDILPGRQDVQFRDTIENFPTGFTVAVTNPPFLAKNSATRRGLNNKIEPYADLYEVCLQKCLSNLKYLAIIVPESFITSTHFKNRLYAVISLTHKKIFKYTEQPVCLALFVPEETKDFVMYKNDLLLGYYNKLKSIDNSFCQYENTSYDISFHHLDGQLGFITTDATSYKKKLKMVLPSVIDNEDVNQYARLRTRIKISHNNLLFKIKNRKKFINDFNVFLNAYREQTHDVFLTSFKGLRDDGNYRRRMSFSKLRTLLLKFLNL